MVVNHSSGESSADAVASCCSCKASTWEGRFGGWQAEDRNCVREPWACRSAACCRRYARAIGEMVLRAANAGKPGELKDRGQHGGENFQHVGVEKFLVSGCLREAGEWSGLRDTPGIGASPEDSISSRCGFGFRDDKVKQNKSQKTARA